MKMKLRLPKEKAIFALIEEIKLTSPGIHYLRLAQIFVLMRASINVVTNIVKDIEKSKIIHSCLLTP
jgi:hypothetical protein